VEVSATYNYKRTNYDQNQYSAGESGTGGIGYYFWETSAFEITYTRGAEILVQSSGTTYQDLTAYGADFLFTVANQGSPFKPYLKLGAVYIIKNLRAFYSNGTVSSPIVDQGTAAQVGLGFKWMLGPRFGIKSGIDVSTSPLNNSSHTTYDFAANIGASFLF
jgi:outer membrane autotransporter protein